VPALHGPAQAQAGGEFDLTWIVPGLALLAAGAAVLGWPRLAAQRRPSREGIEDPAAARAYDRLSRWPQFRLLRRMLVAELASQRPAGALVDLGCGPGYLTFEIARAFPRLVVTGVDISPEMVSAATRHAAELGLGQRVTFRQGDVRRLPLKDGSFDFAVSSLSVHHWADPILALGEIHRILEPGGWLLLFDLRRDARRAFYGLLRFAQAVVVPAALRHAGEPIGSLLASYTPVELQAMLAQSPFGECRLKPGALWVFAWAVKSQPRN